MVRHFPPLRPAVRAGLLLAGFSLFAGSSVAADRSGKDVYEPTCAECPVSGKDLAPKFGDAKA